MGKIFITQDVLKIELKYNSLPEVVEHAWIKYKTPSGEIGIFPGEAVHNVVNSSFYVILGVGEFLENYGSYGDWSFWLWLQLVDGRTIPGEILTERIYAEGT